MKGINIFIVLLISVFFISNVSAVSHTGDVDLQISTSAPDWSLLDADTYNSGISIYNFKYKGLADAGIPDTLVFRDASVGKQATYNWEDIPQNVGGSFALYNGSVFSGSGGITIHRVNNVDVGRVDIWYQFDGTDFVPSDTEINYDVTLYASPITEYYANFQLDHGGTPYSTQNVYVILLLGAGPDHGTHASWSAGGSSYVEYDYYGHFINEYNITLSGVIASTVITRDGLGQQLASSKFKLKNSTYSVVYSQPSYITTNSTTNHDNGSYYYYLDVENYGEVLLYDAITVTGPSVGTIELNQTSYTDPELIQIDVELTTYDFTDNSYYIITEVREDVGSWDNVAGIYNGTTKISTASESRTLDIDTWLYDLPLWVRVKLMEYEKTTGEYTTIYTTGMVRYNPSIPDGIKFGGTVIDADTNQIISGALVSVDGVTTASDTTNAWGEFLMYLYPGIYTVTTSKTGYQTSTSEDLLMEFDNTWAQIYLTPIGYGNGTLYGNVNDADTGYAIKDVHVIITNATDQIDAYTSSGGYYEATGLAQSSTYTIQAVKSGYYTYNGSVTTEASGASHKSFNMVSETATPTPTATVLPTSTYPGGEGHEWTNDEIVTMLRVLVPGFFLLMLVFLLLAVMLGINGNNGNGGQRGLGLDEIWKR
jgi:hypothetical protein